jgi:hypothetical protein
LTFTKAEQLNVDKVVLPNRHGGAKIAEESAAVGEHDGLIVEFPAVAPGMWRRPTAEFSRKLFVPFSTSKFALTGRLILEVENLQDEPMDLEFRIWSVQPIRRHMTLAPGRNLWAFSMMELWDRLDVSQKMRKFHFSVRAPEKDYRVCLKRIMIAAPELEAVAGCLALPGQWLTLRSPLSGINGARETKAKLETAGSARERKLKVTFEAANGQGADALVIKNAKGTGWFDTDDSVSLHLRPVGSKSMVVVHLNAGERSQALLFDDSSVFGKPVDVGIDNQVTAEKWTAALTLDLAAIGFDKAASDGYEVRFDRHDRMTGWLSWPARLGREQGVEACGTVR